jgi:hypothetical protein
VVVATAILLTGCGGSEADAPVATQRCDPVTFPQIQFGSHLIGDREPPVPYSSTPPTSGWHTSGAVPVGIFEVPLSEPAQVSVLEAGGVVVTHSGLSDDDVARLHDLVADTYSDRVVVSPYEGIPEGTTTFTSWGAMQVCEGVDLPALVTYVDAYANVITGH